jgi:hypothetical protein
MPDELSEALSQDSDLKKQKASRLAVPERLYFFSNPYRSKYE